MKLLRPALLALLPATLIASCSSYDQPSGVQPTVGLIASAPTLGCRLVPTGAPAQRAVPGPSLTLGGDGVYAAAAGPEGVLVLTNASDGGFVSTFVYPDGTASAGTRLPLPPPSVTSGREGRATAGGGPCGFLFSIVRGGFIVNAPFSTNGTGISGPIGTGIAATLPPSIVPTESGWLLDTEIATWALTGDGVPTGDQVGHIVGPHAVAEGDGTVLFAENTPGSNLVKVWVASPDLRSVGAPSGWPILAPDAPYEVTGLRASYEEGEFLVLATTWQTSGGSGQGPLLLATFDRAGEGLQPVVPYAFAGDSPSLAGARGLFLVTSSGPRVAVASFSAPWLAAAPVMSLSTPSVTHHALVTAYGDVAALLTDATPGPTGSAGVYVQLLRLE